MSFLELFRDCRYLSFADTPAAVASPSAAVVAAVDSVGSVLSIVGGDVMAPETLASLAATLFVLSSALSAFFLLPLGKSAVTGDPSVAVIVAGAGTH